MPCHRHCTAFIRKPSKWNILIWPDVRNQSQSCSQKERKKNQISCRYYMFRMHWKRIFVFILSIFFFSFTFRLETVDLLMPNNSNNEKKKHSHNIKQNKTKHMCACARVNAKRTEELLFLKMHIHTSYNQKSKIQQSSDV